MEVLASMSKYIHIFVCVFNTKVIHDHCRKCTSRKEEEKYASL